MFHTEDSGKFSHPCFCCLEGQLGAARKELSDLRSRNESLLWSVAEVERLRGESRVLQQKLTDKKVRYATSCQALLMEEPYTELSIYPMSLTKQSGHAHRILALATQVLHTKLIRMFPTFLSWKEKNRSKCGRCVRFALMFDCFVFSSARIQLKKKAHVRRDPRNPAAVQNTAEFVTK